jgi:cyanophycin synthetase
LQNLAGMQSGFGKARETSVRGVYKMAFRTRQEQVGRAALAAANDLLMAAIDNRPFDLDATVVALRDMVDSLCLGPSTAHIVDAATDRGIPHIRLTDGNLVQLGHGSSQRRIWTAETDHTSAIAEEIASDKDLTKSLLSSCGVPVPQGQLVQTLEEAWEIAQDVGLPVAIKPEDGNHGRGVSLDLTQRHDVEAAFTLAQGQGSGGVIIEQFIPGNEHRLLIVGKRVIAAARGETASVVGDGQSTILELVNSQLNSDPRRGINEDAPLGLIEPDKSAEIQLDLERQGFTAASIPAKEQTVLIQRNGNVANDVTDIMHPSVAAMAALAARVVGLDIAGVDMVLEDISKPLNSQRGAVVEVNASPGLLAHLKPAAGLPRPIGKAIIEHLFDAEKNGRIPVVGVTGTQNTTRIARLIAWLLFISGKNVGLSCQDGFFLGNRLVDAKDGVNWEGSERVLINRGVDAGVFENSSRMILSEGLAYDKCSVGVVTDVSDFESLNEFYIDTSDKLYNVVRTQVDVILPTGTAVLNAADPQVVEMAPLCDGKVIFYGLDAKLPAIASHRSSGERVVFLHKQQIVMSQGMNEVGTIPLSTLKPSKADQPEMVMAAVAAAWALGLSTDLIGAGLRTFDSTSKKSI